MRRFFVDSNYFKKYFLYNLILAFLFILLNSKFLYLTYLKLCSGTLILYEIFIYLILFLFIIYFFSFSKIFNRIWLTTLLILSFIGIYFVDTMGVRFDKEIIRNVFETNFNEAFELLGFSFFIYLFIAIISIFIINKIVINKIPKYNFKQYIAIVLSLIAIYFLSSRVKKEFYLNFIKNDSKYIAPIGEIRAIFDYIRTLKQYKKIDKKDLSRHFNFDKNSTEPITVVVVIGESSRGDRFSLNGYNRETNPKLSNLKNLVSYQNATSCNTSTLNSVPCMLSRKTHNKFSFPIDEVSFVKIFTNLGFKTYWISMQKEAQAIKTFCNEADECIDISNNKFDEVILNEYNKILQKSKTQNRLIVIHTMGSHYEYYQRVPKNFIKFKPICKMNSAVCHRKELDNSYDNTIYYIDYILYNIIKPIENHNAFLIYSSDHGDSLGEKQYGIFPRFGHASPLKVAPREQTLVPFIFWGSDKFVKRHKIDTDIKNISHDYIYHSVLKCSGFKSKYIDNNLSICE